MNKKINKQVTEFGEEERRGHCKTYIRQKTQIWAIKGIPTNKQLKKTNSQIKNGQRT